MRLALMQLNPTVGDLSGNAERMLRAVDEGLSAGADLLVFPELAVCGYPPRDLLLQEGFVEECEAQCGRVAERARGMTALIGSPRRLPGKAVANALAVARDGRVERWYDKRLLPTYDVFDEDRYFQAGDAPAVIDVRGVRVGLSICEDLWRGEDVGAEGRYAGRADPVAELVEAGAGLIVSASASPFVLGKGARQRGLLTRHVAAREVSLAAVNQVGGNDELIFDGHAAVYVPGPGPGPGRGHGTEARLIAAGPGFREHMSVVDLPAERRAWGGLAVVEDPLLGAPAEQLLWEALVLGVRDYCRKVGFSRVVLGLSGGIDSAVTVCIAAAALGREVTLTVSMPSRFSSEGSRTDAQKIADALGVRMITTPIEGPHRAVEETLRPGFAELGADPAPGVAEENVQARLRGLILMAYSNKIGALLLTTGNKSELAVGYCTLYGDMNGGLAVLADVTKAQVYRLARWINANAGACGFARAPIPEAVLTKPPSAELRPNQTDQDTLPPYAVVDEVVARYVERKQSPGRIAAESGIGAATVSRLVRMIDASEFKRKQSAIGLKVTDVAFGVGRRYPIAQGWRPGV